MKIIGGQFKGRNFFMPAGIKPTQGLLRAAIFDLLGQDMEGLSFLDLYAGSGAVGLEAASRGASRVVLVEKEHGGVVQRNCALLGVDMGGSVRLIQGDALATVKELGAKKERFDIVFFDPPFGRRLGKKTLKVVYDNDILHGQSLIVAQYDHTERLEAPEGSKVLIDRSYGKSQLTVFQAVK